MDPRLSWLPALLSLAACGNPVVAEQYLAIVNVAPPHGAINIGLDTEVIATFSAALDASTVTTSNAWIEDEETGTPVDAAVNYDASNWSITITPAEDLAPDTAYVATWNAGITSSSAGALSTPISSSFTTRSTAADTNVRPVAEAGDSVVVAVGDTVLLDGSASYDPEGAALTFGWSMDALPEDSTAVLDDSALAQPSFVADLPGEYALSLVVFDGTDLSDPDYAFVTAE